MPMWVSEDGEEMVAVGSVAELKELSGVEVIALTFWTLGYVCVLLLPDGESVHLDRIFPFTLRI